MRTIEKTIYQYSELSDKAKEKAREWYRSCDDGWYVESVIDDAAECADILGIDLRQTRKTRMDNSHFYAPTVYYSGFWSQGDGACFEGTYRYAKGSAKKIRTYAPTDEKLHRIADQLQAVQRQNFYRLTASMKHHGHYQHSGCMSVDVVDSENEYRDLHGADDDITQLMRDFADWIYSRLEAEYEYQKSDEAVEESILANKDEFTEEGEIA